MSKTSSRSFPPFYPPVFVLLGVVAITLIGKMGWPVFLQFPAMRTFSSVGVGAIILGILTLIFIRRQFHIHRTSILPDHDPKTMITTGLFAYSRNPAYIAMGLILLGAAILSAHGASFLVIVAYFIWIGRRWISVEEAAMQKQFGADFDTYCASVKRWL